MSKGKMGQGGHGGHGGSGGMGGKFAGSQNFSFTFSTDNADVLSLSRVAADGTSSRTLDISASTFVTTVGTNDLGSSAVVAVAETRTDTNAVTTRTYTDQDGDKLYTESFDLRVLTATDTRTPLHTFTFNTDGTIATDTWTCGTGTRSETIDSNEHYAKVTLGSDTYVTKTTSVTSTTGTASSYFFEVFRDDNADGSWTQVACGHSSGTDIDTTAGTVSLTGIQTLLAASDAITG